MSIILDINWLYSKYYGEHPELRKIVYTHSEQVAKKALQICINKHLPLDLKDVYCGAMLHDIGVVKCNAPTIYANGSLPYIMHGIEGEKILEMNGLMQYSGICARHTGAGLSLDDIKNNKLPLPLKDMLPLTLLEKLICYADKFFSKSSDLLKEKSLDEIILQMKNYGEDSYRRFMDMHSLFSQEN